MKTKLFLAAVITLIAVDVAFAIPMSKTNAQASDVTQSDKYDGDCTGLETAGRCADKCPTGSYEIGREHDGAAICHLEPTGCPYGDSIPLDSPKCAPSPEELAQQQAQAAEQQALDAMPVQEFEGK